MEKKFLKFPSNAATIKFEIIAQDGKILRACGLQDDGLRRLDFVCAEQYKGRIFCAL